DCVGETALVASCLILVNNVFVSNAINDAGRLTEHFVGSSLIACGDSLTYPLDVRTIHRTQAGVMFVASSSLAGALASLCCIGHVYPVAKCKCKAQNSSPIRALGQAS